MSERPEPALVGWIVDVQRDFMEPDGRLYVRDLSDPSDPGARLAEPAIVRTVEWLKGRADVLVYTGDWHGLEDPEIDRVAPDPGRGTYPPHCMGRSDDPEERSGAFLLPSVAPADPVVLEVDAGPAEAVRAARAAVSEGRPLFIRKTRFDVFEGNRGTERLLMALAEELGRPLRFVVAGVARDVCVTQAVDGLQERGHPVSVVRDATWGLGLETEAATLARWVAKGGTLVDSGDLGAEPMSGR
jgi:nicotinamidase/pyrazinamidase